MNKQQLANKIWESANRMRSKIEANEYKDYILGFIFYKYLSDKEEQWLESQGYTADDVKNDVNEDNDNELDFIQRNMGYFIAYKDLFSTWIGMKGDFSVDSVSTALSSFTRLMSPTHAGVFKDIFKTLETGLGKLGENTQSQTKAVRDLIHLINEIPMDGRQDYDVLGFIYEYLIEKFAANAGKKAGEFYTPHEVSLLMSEIIASHLRSCQQGIKIYDPTSGSGSLLINIGHAIEKYTGGHDKIRYYAQELKANTYNLTRMNLVMRGIKPTNIVTRNADTLEDDWPQDADGIGQPLYVDAVVSNPPYSQRWEPKNKELDPRYARFGLAPKTKADYAFLLHDLYHLKPHGIMTIVLPHGVLFRGGEEGKIRRNLIEENHIDTIIGLPSNIFYGTGIPTIIMVLRQQRENDDVLIVDASKGFVKEGKNNKLRASDIRRIVDVVTGRQDIAKFSRRVSRQEIRDNDYNLNIPRYVDSSEDAETWDTYALMFGGIPETELAGLTKFWQVFPTLKEDLLDSDGQYANLRVKDIKTAIRQNEDVKEFLQKYEGSLTDFKDKMRNALIENAVQISIVQTQEAENNALLTRYENIPLIDKYEAYEIFHEGFVNLAGDLEIIQAEGWASVRQVDANMVIKKVRGREQEVQDGWKGHILPFELVQKEMLPEELAVIEHKKQRLADIPSLQNDIFEELSEDDKETIREALTDENDAFVLKNIPAMLKSLAGDEAQQELIKKLKQVDNLTKEEKLLKAAIKEEELRLHEKTKQVIEALTDAEMKDLLQVKWINPIYDSLLSLPLDTIDYLTKCLSAMYEKYADTYEAIDSEIDRVEAEISAMLGDITGDEADMAGVQELQKLLRGES